MSPALPKNNNWHYVYLLSSKIKKRIYIGCTSNLQNRLSEHKAGNVFSTKSMLPLGLIYYEAYNSKELAYKREKRLKKYGSGLAKLKLRIGVERQAD